mgnify:CR=1 FL=1
MLTISRVAGREADWESGEGSQPIKYSRKNNNYEGKAGKEGHLEKGTSKSSNGKIAVRNVLEG